MNSIQTMEVFDDWFAGLKDKQAVQREIKIVILLAGGNKSTQSKDIKTALEIVRQI